jgi:hypothetical protein
LMTTYFMLHWWQPTLSYIDDNLLYLVLMTTYFILHWWQPTLSFIDDNLLYLILMTAYFILYWWQPTLSYIDDSLLYLILMTAYTILHRLQHANLCSILHWRQPTKPILYYIWDSLVLLFLTLVTSYSIILWWKSTISYIDVILFCITID